MMNKVELALLTTVLLSQGAYAKVIYGVDNRVEVSEATPFQQKLAQSAASMISIKKMTSHPAGPGRVQFNQESLRSVMEFDVGDKRVLNLFTPKVQRALSGRITFCAGERFVDQPNPSMCSGFLIAPDLIVTAGHCADMENFCSEYKWVFGFQIDPVTNTAGLDVKTEDIYGCKRVVSQLLSDPLKLDYAIVQLDRRVTNREPLEIRNQGQVEVDTPLVIVGSPSGLPLKVADGAQVRSNSHPYFFNANLDSYQGNSGSAVFNANTGVIEGILVRGDVDYLPNVKDQCIESNRCPDSGCKGEDVTRLTAIPEIGVQNTLNQAAETGDVARMEKILKLNLWIDFYSKDGESAFIKASKMAQAKAMEMLLARGADVNLQDAEGNTGLHHLFKVLNKKSEPALDVLIAAGANFNIVNKKGETALHLVSKNKAGLKILTKRGLVKNSLLSKE
jgi:Trypsin-like peptidase domain